MSINNLKFIYILFKFLYNFSLNDYSSLQITNSSLGIQVADFVNTIYASKDSQSSTLPKTFKNFIELPRLG